MIRTEDIKKLREMTNLGIMDCKSALVEAGGDFNKALKILKERGVEIARKKEERPVKEGVIESYIHFDSKKGAMVEINCETDFVSRLEEFKKFAKDIAMQVAAASPLYVRKEDIDKKDLDKFIQEGGSEEEYYNNFCLLEQNFIKDPSIKIKDYLNQIITKTEENIVIKRFVRCEIGE